jgi:hypothetical protein
MVYEVYSADGTVNCALLLVRGVEVLNGAYDLVRSHDGKLKIPGSDRSVQLVGKINGGADEGFDSILKRFMAGERWLSDDSVKVEETSPPTTRTCSIAPTFDFDAYNGVPPEKPGLQVTFEGRVDFRKYNRVRD